MPGLEKMRHLQARYRYVTSQIRLCRLLELGLRLVLHRKMLLLTLSPSFASIAPCALDVFNLLGLRFVIRRWDLIRRGRSGFLGILAFVSVAVLLIG